jgi:hypothetical protein
MQIVEIEDGLAVKISELAKSENKSLTEFVNLTLRETLDKKKRQRSDEEKLKKFAESYQEFPQQSEEYEIWENEQIWENK